MNTTQFDIIGKQINVMPTAAWVDFKIYTIIRSLLGIGKKLFEMMFAVSIVDMYTVIKIKCLVSVLPDDLTNSHRERY